MSLVTSFRFLNNEYFTLCFEILKEYSKTCRKRPLKNRQNKDLYGKS